MQSLEALYSLIRSMTKSEKRYFQLMTEMQKGEKSYWALFDYLDRHRVYDPKVVEGLKQKFPGNTIEASRKHLYKVIMKSLRQFDSDKDVETRLMNLLQESRILYNKGLIKLSIDQLGKIKTIALEHEKFFYYILAAKQELKYLVRSQFSGIDEYQLLEKQKSISEFIEQESRIHQHAMLYEVLLLRYWKNGIARSQQEATMLNDLLLEEYQLLNSPGQKPFELLQLHLYFQSTYFQMTGNARESLNVFYELDALFQKHQNLWKDSPIYYFHLLDGILFDLRWMDRYEDMNFFLGRLKAISASADSLSGLINLRVLEHELNRFVDKSKFREAQSLLDKHGPSLRLDDSSFPFHIYSRFNFAVARVLLGTGDYSSALKIINRVLNHSTASMNHSQYVMFQLINLQVNALLSNVDYLYYAVRSVERKLKGERRLHGVEQLIISILKRVIAYKSLKGFNEKIEALEQNPYERQLIKELSLKQWLQRLTSKT